MRTGYATTTMLYLKNLGEATYACTSVAERLFPLTDNSLAQSFASAWETALGTIMEAVGVSNKQALTVWFADEANAAKQDHLENVARILWDFAGTQERALSAQETYFEEALLTVREILDGAVPTGYVLEATGKPNETFAPGDWQGALQGFLENGSATLKCLRPFGELAISWGGQLTVDGFTLDDTDEQEVDGQEFLAGLRQIAASQTVEHPMGLLFGSHRLSFLSRGKFLSIRFETIPSPK